MVTVGKSSINRVVNDTGFRKDFTDTDRVISLVADQTCSIRSDTLGYTKSTTTKNTSRQGGCRPYSLSCLSDRTSLEGNTSSRREGVQGSEKLLGLGYATLGTCGSNGKEVTKVEPVLLSEQTLVSHLSQEAIKLDLKVFVREVGVK